MSDGDDNALVRRVRRVASSTRRRAGKLVRPVSWVRETADRLIISRVEEQLERWLLSLAEPENARRLQSALAHIAQLGMEMGFRADPDAARLYELVAWLEEAYGRPPVLRRVAEHAASTESTVLGALASILDGYSQPPGSTARQDAARRMHELRDVASRDLLDLLCGLAALTVDDELPASSVEARVAFYEEADLPVEFGDLAAMAAGLPGAFDESPEADEPDALGAMPDDERRRGLTQFVPSFDDPHLRFLTLSHLFFLQSYLTRNLVEALPELLAEARRYVQ